MASSKGIDLKRLEEVYLQRTQPPKGPESRLIDAGVPDRSVDLQRFEDTFFGTSDGEAVSPRKRTDAGFLESFIRTAIHEAGPGLIGIAPPEVVEEFQQEYPLWSIGALFLGAAGPYGLGAKFGLRAAAKTPGLRRLLRFADDIDRARESPALARGAKELAKFIPFETARAGAAAVGGDFGETLGHIAFELPLIGVGGAAIAKISGGTPLPGKTIKGEHAIRARFPDYQINETPQFKLSQVNQILRTNSEEEVGGLMTDLQHLRKMLAREVLKQERPTGKAYVQRLVGGKSASTVNDRFREKNTPDLLVRRLHNGNFKDDELEAMIGTVTPRGVVFEEIVQYPTMLRAKTKEGSQKIRDFFIEKFTPVGNGLDNDSYIVKEADGVWVFAKRIMGKPLEQASDDTWLMFKTNKPGAFNQSADRFGETLTKGAFHHMNDALLEKEARDIPTARFIWRMMKVLRSKDLSGPQANVLTQKLAEVLSPELQTAGKNLVEGAGYLKEKLKPIIAPSIQEFKDSPNAVTIMSIVRATYGRSMSRAANVFFGRDTKSSARTLFGSIFERGDRVGGLEKWIDGLTDEQLIEVNRAWLKNMSISEMRAQGMSSGTVEFYRRLQRVDTGYSDELMQVAEFVGDDFFTPMENHYMLTRTWRGTQRLPIYEKNTDGTLGQLVAYGSGHNRRQTLKEADDLIRRVAEEEGITIDYKRLSSGKPSELRTVGRDENLELARQVMAESRAGKAVIRVRQKLLDLDPERFKERKGVRGFAEHLTRKEMKEIIYGNVIESERAITSRLLNHLLSDDIKKLTSEVPVLAQGLVRRMNAYAGDRGPINKLIDKGLDPILAPWFGKNAASEIVRSANRAIFGLTLGAGDMGFATMNALTPVQTLLPEIAFVLTAHPQRLAEMYGQALVLTRDGIPHQISYLDPLRIMGKAIKAMGNPDDELKAAFEWAKKHRHVGPRFIEEFAGQNSAEVLNVKALLNGEEGFLNYLKALSEWAPGKSEELSRGLGFVVGHMIGKNFFKLEGDRLLQFAAEMTGRSNYLYSTADRPRIITGAVGSLYGLFKNWSINYTANFMNYAGEGVLRNNWHPLMWQMGGTFALGGAGALPLYGIADSMSQVFTDKTLTVNLYEGFGGEEPGRAIDTFMYGLPAMLPLGGMSLQARVSPTGASLVRDLDFAMSSATLDRAVALGEAIGGAIDVYSTTGRHPVDSQAVRDQFYRALLPRTWYRSLQFTKDNALRSLRTGNRLISDITMPQRAAFILGFTPLDVEKSFESTGELFRQQNVMREKVSVFGETLSHAYNERDYDRVKALYRRAITEGVPLDSVLRSTRAFQAKQNEDLIERQFDTYAAYQMNKALGIRR